MNGETRRQIIINRLKESVLPISAIKFAEEFSVTRQIIVADIALLRAAGHPIRAEHKGYVWSNTEQKGLIKRIAVKHGKEELRQELYVMVDNGAKVLDVLVEHTVYGVISGQLNLATRYDVDTFVSKVETTGASPLSTLTEGLHVHTLSVPDEQSFARIVDGLTKLGVFIDSD